MQPFEGALEADAAPGRGGGGGTGLTPLRHSKLLQVCLYFLLFSWSLFISSHLLHAWLFLLNARKYTFFFKHRKTIRGLK